MDKYSWSFSEDNEFWYETGSSIEDCIEQAQNENDEGYDTVFIGENTEVDIIVDADMVLERLDDELYEAVGEGYEGREFAGSFDDIDDLSSRLTEVVVNWLKEHGNLPKYYTVSNVRGYPLDKVDNF